MCASRIYVLGGGGFSDTPDNLLIERYILDQLGVEKPRVCFIPTASRDSQGYVARFRAAFTQLGADCDQILLTSSPSYAEIRDSVSRASVFYVGGGNTQFMLESWAQSGLDKMLKEAIVEHGKTAIGISAGALCWFEEGLSDYVPGKLERLGALGLIPTSFCPHLDSEPERFDAFSDFVKTGRMIDGLGLDDHVAVEYTDFRVTNIVSSVADRFAFQFRRVKGQLEIEKIRPNFLGTSPHRIP